MLRTNLTRRHFVVGASAAVLTSGAPLYAAEQEEPKGGIGGTGIVGTLTDFGSLMVNGRRILLSEETVISGPLGPIAEADLAVGQVLTIEASVTGDVAARVFVSDPVIGRVKAIYPDERAFWVDGQFVRLDASAGPLPRSGDWVAVSGLWRGGEIYASRLAPSEAGRSAIAGVYRTRPSALAKIGGESVLLPDGMTPPPDGTFVVVRGDHQAGAFFVDEMDVGRFFGAAGPLKTLSVEGYLDPISTAPFYEVAGLGHSFDPDARLGAVKDLRAVFEGPYTGDFAVSTAIILPETQSQRRSALRTGATDVVGTR